MHIAIDAHSVRTGLAGNETYAANLVETYGLRPERVSLMTLAAPPRFSKLGH